MNDINILNASPIYRSVLDGTILPTFKYNVKNRWYDLPYCLVDGIYPSRAIFIDTIRLESSRKGKFVSAHQEGARKDVERAFGVLISRWHLLIKPFVFHSRQLCKAVVKSAIIMHNIIVEVR